MIAHRYTLSEAKWLALIFLAFCWLGVPGAIDGRLWPVATPMSLTKWEDDGSGRTRFYGTSEKLRNNCAWRGFEWRLGDFGIDHVPVTIDTEMAVSRPAGRFAFGPWIANVPPVKFLRTHAIVLHQCFVTTPFVAATDEAGQPEYLKIPYPFITRSVFWR